jgi:hypothetical protein
VRTLLTVVLVMSLVGHFVSYVWLTSRVIRQRGLRRAWQTLLVPPMSALWGYEIGERRWVLVYLATLLTYAVAVAVA